jgi:uroporphyrinogen decarboxylase
VSWQPDYRYFEQVMRNEKPSRLPLYEHLINPGSMDQITGRPFASLAGGDAADRREYFRRYCDFYREMTYDTVSIEFCVNGILPGGGALLGEHPGPIQNRADFEAYPWADLPRIYRERAYPMFDLLREVMPAGMKGVGGVGNGVFEISEDLVGFEWLCYLQADDPELFADLYRRIGDLLLAIWSDFLPRYGDLFAACRIGDDLGYKTGTLLSPNAVLEHVIPQYRRVVAAIHAAGKPYLQHSCGCIFDVMDAWIDAGIDAKHSNEDAIAPFEEWIRRYGDRIALVGGVDTDRLCRMSPDEIVAFTVESGTRFRQLAKGFALGSGNSIPEYVPAAGYLAMIEGVRRIRESER